MDGNNYDRLIGALHGLPDVVSTKASAFKVTIPMVGISESFIIQTYRQRERGDYIFLETVSASGSIRIALPPEVADTIARQRDALTTKLRSKQGKANAQARKDRGELPGFMRKRKA